MEGALVYPIQGGLLVPGQATRRWSKEPEVFDLVDFLVKAIDPMDDDWLVSSGKSILCAIDQPS
jgi:hypothetical protein